MTIEVLLPAVFAALVAILVTVAIERFGGRVGGLIATLPSTIVPASIGFYGESENYAHAMWAVPVGMTVNFLFLWSWRWLPRFAGRSGRLAKVLAASLCLWALAAGSAVWLLGRLEASLSVLAWGVTLVTMVLGAWACTRNPPTPYKARRVGVWTLLSRGVLAGLAIAVAVLLSKQSPLLACMASVFPAIFLTTMVSLWLAQGEDFQASAVGPMMLGSTAVSVYALIATYSLPEWGVWAGPAVAWLGSSLLVTLPAWWWLERLRRSSLEA